MRENYVPMSWLVNKLAYDSRKSLLLGGFIGYFLGGVLCSYSLLYLMKRGVNNV